jgi:hypothetical protein
MVPGSNSFFDEPPGKRGTLHQVGRIVAEEAAKSSTKR